MACVVNQKSKLVSLTYTIHRIMRESGLATSQFYASESEHKKKGASEFEQELVRLGIRHILARVNHPQTNGKLERFHGEI